METNYMKSS